MDIDALLLSRIQFVWVIAWHILLPALTIGLACWIATLEVLWWVRKKDVYRRLSAFWIKIFAVSFGMGVVSGIVMPFQFGTNWSRFIDLTGSVVGGLMAYEVITAFFLEAAFLGVLLFGRDKVPQWAHVLSAVMVALGTLLSSFWILAVNSWMQTPRGFEIVDGRFVPVDMVSVIFTPSFPYRLAHTVSAFVITTGFVVLAVGALFLRRGRHVPESRIMVRMALGFLAIMVPAQIVIGDLHGLNTLEHQPAKVAAMEGLWDSGTRVPMSLVAWPDRSIEGNRFEIAVLPGLASLYLTHDVNGFVRGLKDFPPDERPPVAIVYWAFRVMVGIGVAMLAIVLWGLWRTWKRTVYEPSAFLRVAQWSLPLGFIAVLAGWTVTEVGRQPWVVYGHLRTADAVTPSLTTQDVALSLTAYVLAYLVIFGGGLWLLIRMVRKGPALAAHEQRRDRVEAGPQRPKRPLSAVTDSPPSADAAPPGAQRAT
jgi:cytochrome bd ubiquinol oxidase subunit I